MTSNAESQDNNNTPSESTLTDTYTTQPTEPLTQTSLDNTSLLEYSSVSLCEQEASQPISFESIEYNISIQEHISTPPVPVAIHSATKPCVATDTAAAIHSTTVIGVADAIHSITETSVAHDTAPAIPSTSIESHNEGEQNQTIDNSTAVGQEDRIEIFTSGMEDEQEFPNTDGINTKQKVGEQGPSFDTKENGNIEQTPELSDKENKQREINKDKSHSTLHRSSRKLDESSRDKKRGIAKHLEHHTHKDLREILTKNSFAANKSREFEDRKIKKTSRSGLDMSISRDRESTQRHRRMYQEIKNTLSSSSSAVFNSRDIDPEREWEDKKREREIQRIEVERARRELETRRRQESQSSLHSTNGLKRSLSSYTQDSRPLTIDGGHSEYPIPPIVPPLASDLAATRIARIQNLVRPFTQQQLKSMLDLYGPLIVGTDTPHHYFWTDKNKTQCCCVYQNIESCEKARNALHGARWPSINPKNLNFSFLSIENFNELTGLGITQGILDKTKQEIIVEKQSTPPQRIDKGKEREKVKEKDKVREKEKKDKPREKEKEKTKERAKEKEKTKEKENIKVKDKDKSKDPEQHKETKEVSKKIKKEKTTNEPIEERSTGPSTEKKQHVTVKKESTHKSIETIQTKTKQIEPTLEVESAPKPPKPIEPSVKVYKEEKPKLKQEKPKSSEKKTPIKRPAPTLPCPAPPQPKKPRESKDTPAVHSDSDMESDNYQCSGQAALLDTLFRKTVAEPCIYWLPLTDEQIKAKLRRNYMEAAKSSESHSRKKRKYTPSPKRKRK